MNKINALVYDNDNQFLDSLQKAMITFDVDIIKCSRVENIFIKLKEQSFDALILCIDNIRKDGFELLENLNESFNSLPIILISNESTIATAVNALRMGAFDFIEKPLQGDKLKKLLVSARYQKNLAEETYRLQDELEENRKLVGTSNFTKDINNDIETLANTKVNVLITGETGTGKELVAWALHQKSERRNKPYVKINCAAIPAELLESELFGYKKGAFTGADLDKKGKFEAAEGGTVFLDEIGELDFKLQSKLLRLFEQNEIEVIGDSIPKQVNVRIVTATNRNLKLLAENGSFRYDLFHRLNVARIHILPLRERVSDILPIAYHYIKVFSDVYNKRISTITTQAAGVLQNHAWPGNVRELKSVIENIILFSSDNSIEISAVLNAIQRLSQYSSENFDDSSVNNLNEAKAEFEKNFVLDTLERNNWKINESAQSLKIDRTNLFRKMKKYNLKKTKNAKQN